MAKSPSKPKLDIVSDMFVEETINGEYMFTNRKYNLQVYVDADGWREAEDKFDTCQFENPNDWEIYLKVKERSN